MNKQKFYRTRQWWHCRGLFIKSKNYLCERCGRVCWSKGDSRYKQAKEKNEDVVFGIVHHKEYLTESNIGDPNISLNWDNLEYLCITCHNKKHMTKDTEVRKDIVFDEFGNIRRK